MTWEKQNLVTLKDMSDIYKCSECGYKQKFFGIAGRPAQCPKCKPEDIYGGWSNINELGKSRCYHCNYLMIKVTEDHPNGKYLHLKRYDNEILLACPNNCGEQTGIKPGVKKRPILK